MKNKFYITTAIHYSSGLPHIGHAYENIMTDTIARYKRLFGHEVYFLTGLDEHGQKIAEVAAKNNMEPQQWTDYIATKFKELWERLHISNNGFIRTTEPRHEQAVQKIFSEMLANHDVYLGEWKSLYCIGCEEAYTEDDAVQKDDGLYCRVGHKLMQREEPSYFFEMKKYNGWISEYFDNHKNFLLPQYRVAEMKNNFIDKGLEDLSISRVGFAWGIPILEDPKHTVYVWLDALFNYITALGFKQEDDSLYKKFWVDEDTEVAHVVGKDIARFHTIFWPIMLHSMKLRIPNHVLGHGWIMAEDGRKMSKSFGNVVDPNELIDSFGSDATRYYFTKEFSYQNDNNFSYKKFKETFNADLSNIFGNIVNRTIGMLKLYRNGIVYKPKSYDENSHMNAGKNNLLKNCERIIKEFNIKQLVEEIVEFGKSINKYIEDTKPWELQKNGKFDELDVFLYDVVDAIRVYTILLQPILTEGTKEMIKQMNFNDDMIDYANIASHNLIVNLKVNESSPIYNRIAIE